MEERGSRVTEGRLVARAARTAIVRYPLSTALPIPLAIADPPGIRLVTWAFAGLRAEDALGPRGLLVLALDEGAEPRAGLRLATHFRAIDLAISETGDGFRAEERALVARAMLAAASPGETATLADLVGLLGGDMAAIAPEPDAPEIAPDREGRWRLSGSDVPGHLLLREGASWSCHRIARASLHFGGPVQDTGSSHPPPHPEAPRSGLEGGFQKSSRALESSFDARLRLAPRIESGAGSQDEGVGGSSVASPGPQALLTLDRVWGKAPAGQPDRAIGLSKDGLAPYRIAG